MVIYNNSSGNRNIRYQVNSIGVITIYKKHRVKLHLT